MLRPSALVALPTTRRNSAARLGRPLSHGHMPSTTDVRTCSSGNADMIAYHLHDAASAVLSFPSQSPQSPAWLLCEFHGPPGSGLSVFCFPPPACRGTRHGAINLPLCAAQSSEAGKRMPDAHQQEGSGVCAGAEEMVSPAMRQGYCVLIQQRRKRPCAWAMAASLW